MHSASRVPSSARSDVSRASSRVSNPSDPRARPLRRVAHPGYHSWHPVGQNPPLLPPMSAPVESAEAHAGDDDDESLTARCARWMAHTAAATTTDPCPCSADPDEPGQVRAPPLYSVVWQEKNIPFSRVEHVLAGIRHSRPQTAANPAGSVRPGISALLVKVSRPTPSPALFPDPPLLTSHPPSPEPPRSRLDAPTSTTTYPTIAKTPIRCGGSWRSRCGRWP